MNAAAPDRYQALRNLFLQEMHALQEEGKSFAQEYPEAAALLDPTRVEDRDPGVERLVEAFSYLTARVREASEMEQDGLEGHLLELFEDGLDHILPSVVVFQAAARRKHQKSTQLARGAEFRTPGTRTSGCRFTLLHELPMDPVEIVRAQIELDERGTSSLELELRGTDSDVGRWPDPLPVFLHGDAPVVWSLRYGLSRRAGKIEVWTENGWNAAPGVGFFPLDRPGYDADLRAHPLSDARDFLCCDERFRFVELRGLSSLAAPAEGTLRLRVGFDGAFPRAVVRGVSAEAFRLHAGVAANRYEDACDGLVWDHTRSEVPLRTANGTSQEILEALKVESSTRSHPPRHTRYFPFSRYRHGTLANAAFFGLHRRRDASGRPLSLLALGWPDLGTPLEDEYVSVHAAFCDGNRPYEETTGREFLPSDPDLRDGLELSTLTRPTPVHRPPPQVALHTRLMTMAMIHFQGILDAERMRDALRLFLWDPAEAKKTLIDAIQEVSVETGHRYLDGIHRPEQRVRIRLRDTTCTPETWERLGMLDAFARILGRLVQDETPLGSLSATTVVIEPAGVELRV